jgi:hypothetical protein
MDRFFNIQKIVFSTYLTDGSIGRNSIFSIFFVTSWQSLNPMKSLPQHGTVTFFRLSFFAIKKRRTIGPSRNVFRLFESLIQTTPVADPRVAANAPNAQQQRHRALSEAQSQLLVVVVPEAASHTFGIRALQNSSECAIKAWHPQVVQYVARTISPSFVLHSSFPS